MSAIGGFGKQFANRGTEINGEKISEAVNAFNGSFSELYANIYGTALSFAEPDKWLGPGYYRITDAWSDASTLQYCNTQEEIDGFCWEVKSFFFVTEDVPQGYLSIAAGVWDGPGSYIVKRLREIAWGADSDWVGWAATPECLADGLFREFDSREIVSIRKANDDENTDDAHWFECPDVFHGRTDF